MKVSDGFLILHATTADINRADESCSWPPVLLLEWMARSGCINVVDVFDIDQQAITHQMFVSSWKHLEGLVYEPEEVSLQELLEPYEVPWDLEARLSEAATFSADAMVAILCHEPRFYERELFEAEVGSPPWYDSVQKAHVQQFHSFRGHPDWESAIRFLIGNGYGSLLYKDCDASALLHLAKRQGFHTLKDVLATKRRANVTA